MSGHSTGIQSEPSVSLPAPPPDPSVTATSHRYTVSEVVGTMDSTIHLLEQQHVRVAREISSFERLFKGVETTVTRLNGMVQPLVAKMDQYQRAWKQPSQAASKQPSQVVLDQQNVIIERQKQMIDDMSTALQQSQNELRLKTQEVEDCKRLLQQMVTTMQALMDEKAELEKEKAELQQNHSTWLRDAGTMAATRKKQINFMRKLIQDAGPETKQEYDNGRETHKLPLLYAKFRGK